MSYGVKITGTGSYAPERIMTNKDWEKLVDTTDEWIKTRTGIEARHFAREDELSSDMGTEAAKKALANANCAVEDIDLIIVATITPDQPFPSTACFVQQKLGAKKAMSFSISAACTGFIYAFEIAYSMLKTGLHQKALVIGSDKMTSTMNWKDRSTCVLFGDGAGAVVLENVEGATDCLLASSMKADGNYADILEQRAGGTRCPITHDVLNNEQQYLHMEGQSVFKLAVTSMASAARKVLKDAGITNEDLDWVIPHQANDRIISAVGKSLKIQDERLVSNVSRYGNTSSATIPIALDELNQSGKLKPNDKVIGVAFGAGLTWGSVLINW